MCLILFAFRQHARYPLVLAANRDEYHARPSAPAAVWEDAPQVLGGRDLGAGGTWLGVTRQGRFAAVTNYREPVQTPGPSRGRLVSDYLTGSDEPSEYLEGIAVQTTRYPGFNLLAGDEEELYYHSNRASVPRALGPGVYGLSNHLLDTPWPKVSSGRTAMERALDAPGEEALVARLLHLLADDTQATDPQLPDTGIGRERERFLSPRFIRGNEYGTRCSTVLLLDASGGLLLHERRFDADGRVAGESRFRLGRRQQATPGSVRGMVSAPWNGV